MFRPVLYISGVFLNIIAVAMLIPMLVDLYQDHEDWRVFLFSSFLTGIVGTLLVFTCKTNIENITLKQTFLITTLSWVVVCFFSGLPLQFSELKLSLVDSVFEAMSGLTTTGATVITGLDNAPPGILMWRSMTQFIGGLGIVVMGLAILPLLKIGGMQLFRAESSDRTEKVLPRVAHVATAIAGVYVGLNILCILGLWLAGMGFFDAVNHSMTVIATGGFSTKDASISYFNNIWIEVVCMAFMFAAGAPLLLYMQAMRNGAHKFYGDSQVQWYFWITVAAISAITLWVMFYNGYQMGDALRYSSFAVITVVTSTGFASADFALWGGFPEMLLFMLLVCGGCTGSTTGGIKIFRFQVLYEICHTQVKRLIYPHGVFRPQFNDRPISDEVSASVLTFFILYAFSFTVMSILLSFTGVDFLTSMSAVASSMSNVGPGLGSVVGPAGNYSSLSDFAKWILTFAMLLGRLEIFTVLILFSRHFWRS